jgi:hypothetical protein
LVIALAGAAAALVPMAALAIVVLVGMGAERAGVLAIEKTIRADSHTNPCTALKPVERTDAVLGLQPSRVLMSRRPGNRKIRASARKTARAAAGIEVGFLIREWWIGASQRGQDPNRIRIRLRACYATLGVVISAYCTASAR